MLDQEKSEEVGNFLTHTSSEQLFVIDFALHSIGVILNKLDKNEVLLQFVNDIFIQGAVSLIHLEPEDMKTMIRIMQQFNLDFDDAYQYVATEKMNLLSLASTATLTGQRKVARHLSNWRIEYI